MTEAQHRTVCLSHAVVIHLNICYEFDEQVVIEWIQFVIEYPTDKYILKNCFLFACLFFIRTMILKLRENYKKECTSNKTSQQELSFRWKELSAVTNNLFQHIILSCTSCHQIYKNIRVMTSESRQKKKGEEVCQMLAWLDFDCINNKSITWSNADLKPEKPWFHLLASHLWRMGCESDSQEKGDWVVCLWNIYATWVWIYSSRFLVPYLSSTRSQSYEQIISTFHHLVPKDLMAASLLSC